MKLFYHHEYERLDHEKAVTACKGIYGTDHPERIGGFDIFNFRLSDIFIYGRLEKWIVNNPDLERELYGFIERFSGEDYGFVTRAEAENNSENKWLCGACCWSIGRYCFENKDYSTQYGGIVLEFLQDRGFLYSIEENMDEIYNEYAKNGYKNDIVFNR